MIKKQKNDSGMKLEYTKKPVSPCNFHVSIAIRPVCTHEYSCRFNKVLSYNGAGAWYFDTPRFEANNNFELNKANSYPMTRWIDYRINGEQILSDIHEKIYNFLFQGREMRKPMSDAYKTKLAAIFGSK